MRFLSLDIGSVRIGFAFGDDQTNTALPGGVIRTGVENPHTAIAALIDKENIEGIVVGLPITLRGTLGPQAKRVRAFVAQLKKKISVPVFFEDERLSTKAVVRMGYARPHLDAAAAAEILQSFLDRRKSKCQQL